MSYWLRTLSLKFKTAFLVFCLLISQVAGAAAPFINSKVAAASVPANNGTLKVHEIGTPSGTENNDPKVCAFNFEGFGFDAGQTGKLQIDVQGNDAPHGAAAGPFAFGPTDSSGYAISQSFNTPGGTPIQNGHYKVTLYGKDANGIYNVDLKAKSKVFKVNCGVQPVVPTITTQVNNSNFVLGQTVADVATLVGTDANGDATGKVDFFVCGPAASNPNCTTGGTQVGGDVTVAGNQAVSAVFTPLAAGKYCFRAVYTPDGLADYLAGSHTNLTTECFNVTVPPTGTITVTKQVVNAHGGKAAVADFPLFVGNTSVTSGTTNTYIANQSYTVSETANAVAGYTQTSLVCTDNATHASLGATFTLKANENVSCIIVNTDIAPTLTLVKKVINNNGGSATSANFQGQINGSNVAWTVSNTESAGTVYTLTENALAGGAGYAASSWVCDGGKQDGNKLTLSLGQNVTCTITNDDIAPQLIVKKHVVNQHGGTASASNFTMNVTGNNVGTPSFPGAEAGTNVSLNPGTYSVGESGGPGGYTGNSSNDCVGVIALGQVKTCTITNSDNPAVISGHKLNVNAGATQGSGGTPVQNWTIYLLVNGQPVAHTTTDANGNYSFTNLNWGNYTLAECQNVSDGCSTWTQIYGPSGVTLGANNLTSTNKDFGNFKNASISGSKFNDVNGNHLWGSGEHGLSGWKIFADTNNDGVFTAGEQSTTTAGDGSYTLSNLAPGTYSICEVPQNGWVQTFPGVGDGCQTVKVTLSGHNYNGINFGNQGRGTITVIKNVDDGFGNIWHDVSNWTWDVGGDNFSTGSTNHQNVAAGSYTVSEHQKTDYHVTASSCTNEEGSRFANTSQHVTVSPGENVVCTFTNTRDTGKIEVTKHLLPSNDNGRFDLQIDGNTKAHYVGNNGSTGDVKVLTGTHSVREVAANYSTHLSYYDSSYVCYDGFSIVAHGNGTYVGNLTVRSGHEVHCIFTNVRHAKVTIIKDAQPDSTQPFNFTLKHVNTDFDHEGNDGPSFDVRTLLNSNNVIKHFTLIDNGNADDEDATNVNSTNLSTGLYEVDEASTADWDLTHISCNAEVWKDLEDGSVKFLLHPGQHLVCTFTNVRQTGTVTVNKVISPTTDNGKFNLNIDETTKATNVSNGGTTGAVTLFTGSHSVSETAGTNTKLSDYDSSYNCSNEMSGTGTSTGEFTVSKNENVTCTFTNVRKATLTVLKKAFPFNSSQSFNFTLTHVAPVVNDEETIQDLRVLNVVKNPNLVKNFQLDDNNDPTLPNSDTSSLTPGVYEVNEASTPGWDLLSMNCGDVTVTKTATSIRFELLPGQQLVCTFTNQKHVVPQVLGASTTAKQLTNTGLPILAFTFAALSLIGTALYVTKSRKTQGL